MDSLADAVIDFHAPNPAPFPRTEIIIPAAFTLAMMNIMRNHPQAEWQSRLNAVCQERRYGFRVDSIEKVQDSFSMTVSYYYEGAVHDPQV